MKSLCVMPVWNQAKQLPKLLDASKAFFGGDNQLIIINNGSDDGSRELIEASGFEYVNLEKNHGIGYALRVGAEKALEGGYEIVANIAGNGKMVPAEIARVCEPIRQGEADYVTGSRFLPGGQYPNLTPFRRWGIPLVVNNVVRLLFFHNLTDATCGLRAFHVKLLADPKVDWKAEWLHRYQFEYYLYAKAIRLGYRCQEVPGSMIYPKQGEISKIPPIVGWWQLLEAWIKVGLCIK
jgi:dolichol-phosphate mannosyltransferase